MATPGATESLSANGHDTMVLLPGRPEKLWMFLPYEDDQGIMMTIADVIAALFRGKEDVLAVCQPNEVTMALTIEDDNMIFMTLDRESMMSESLSHITKDTVVVFVHLKTKKILSILPKQEK